MGHDLSTGVALSLGGTGIGNDAVGVIVGGAGAGVGHDLRGAIAGGIGAGVGHDLTGLAVSFVGVGVGHDLTGVALGGAGVGAGRSIRGIALSVGGIGAGDELVGIMMGGVMVFAPEVRGIAVSAVNGITVGGTYLPGDSQRWFEPVNDRFTGLSIGLINYSRQLRGVQLGLLNFAGNNPPWARLLPFVNAHF